MTKREFSYLKEILKSKYNLNKEEVLEILVEMAENFGVSEDSSNISFKDNISLYTTPCNGSTLSKNISSI